MFCKCHIQLPNTSRLTTVALEQQKMLTGRYSGMHVALTYTQVEYLLNVTIDIICIV